MRGETDWADFPPPAPVTTATRESNLTGELALLALLALELQQSPGSLVRPGLERARERRRELVILTLSNSTSNIYSEFTELAHSLKLLSAGGVKGDTMYSECFSVLVLQL